MGHLACLEVDAYEVVYFRIESTEDDFRHMGIFAALPGH
jgi:hypothetical protein